MMKINYNAEYSKWMNHLFNDACHWMTFLVGRYDLLKPFLGFFLFYVRIACVYMYVSYIIQKSYRYADPSYLLQTRSCRQNLLTSIAWSLAIRIFHWGQLDCSFHPEKWEQCYLLVFPRRIQIHCCQLLFRTVPVTRRSCMFKFQTLSCSCTLPYFTLYCAINFVHV